MLTSYSQIIRFMLIKENRKLRASTNEHVNLYGY